MNRVLLEQSYEHQLLYLIHEIREDHPTMGCRDMYELLKPLPLGRDRFEEFCFLHNLRVKKRVIYPKTTNSKGVHRFENLIKGLKIIRINQVWVSDITYYWLVDQFSYITFILDTFSCRIVGYHVSLGQITEQSTLPALEMAVALRGAKNLIGLIFHSDGGGQYYDTNFVARTAKLKIRNSMCMYPWENPQAERINGVIKNNYLRHWQPKSFEELCQCVDRAVALYNEKKPHRSLNKVSPVTFEKTLS